MMRVLKYGTGWEIPEGAVYLATLVEEKREGERPSSYSPITRYVWHHFLVPVTA